jgi:hypothetical protein
MEAERVRYAIDMKAKEEHRVAFNWFHCQSFLCTFRESVILGLIFPPLSIGEHSLASLLDSGQIHEHRRVTVASQCLIDLVMEIIKVRLILLPMLVSEYLNVLSIF